MEPAPLSAYESRNLIFREIDKLKGVLPISPAILEQQDRPTVVRLSCTLLKLRNYYNGRTLPKSNEVESTTLTLMALDYFCFILDSRCRFEYVTESVSTHLGYSQFQMFGCFLDDFVHPEDLHLLQYIMEEKPAIKVYGNQPMVLEMTHQLTVRFKSKLPKRSCGFVQNGYKAIVLNTFTRYAIDALQNTRCISMFASGHMIENQGYPEIPICEQQFVLRTTPDLCSIFVDSNVHNLLGFQPSELLDKSLYLMIWLEDQDHVQRAHLSLNRPDEYQTVSPFVRFLRCGGGTAEVSLHFIKLSSQNSNYPYSISIICTVVGVSEETKVVDVCQRRDPSTVKPSEAIGAHSSRFYHQAGRPRADRKLLKAKRPHQQDNRVL